MTAKLSNSPIHVRDQNKKANTPDYDSDFNANDETIKDSQVKTLDRVKPLIEQQKKSL